MNLEILPTDAPPRDLLLLADECPASVDDYLPRGRCHVALLDGEVVGQYILLHTRPFTAEVVSLSVAPALQRRGIGTRLLDHAVRTARTLGFRRLEIGTGDTGFDQLRHRPRLLHPLLPCPGHRKRPRVPRHGAPQHGPRPPRTVSPLRIPRCGRLRGLPPGCAPLRPPGFASAVEPHLDPQARRHSAVRNTTCCVRCCAALRPRAIPPRTGGTCLHAPGPPGFPKIAFFPQSASCGTKKRGRYLAVSAPPVRLVRLMRVGESHVSYYEDTVLLLYSKFFPGLFTNSNKKMSINSQNYLT